MGRILAHRSPLDQLNLMDRFPLRPTSEVGLRRDKSSCLLAMTVQWGGADGTSHVARTCASPDSCSVDYIDADTIDMQTTKENLRIAPLSKNLSCTQINGLKEESDIVVLEDARRDGH